MIRYCKLNEGCFSEYQIEKGYHNEVYIFHGITGITQCESSTSGRGSSFQYIGNIAIIENKDGLLSEVDLNKLVLLPVNYTPEEKWTK